MNNNANQFTEGKLLGPLVRFALPVLLALFLQSLYGAVDLLVIGRFGTEAEVSAVATGTQMMHIVTNLFIGLAMGATIIFGQMIGAGRLKQAGEVIGSSICLFLTLALMVTALLFLFARTFATLMHTPAEAFDYALSYVRICTGGTVFIVAYNVLGSIFRGLGDSKTPLLTVAIACVCNIVGDLFFVGVMRLSAAGAAIATVMAQAVSVLISILIIRKRGLPFPFSKNDIRFEKDYVFHILKMGFPVALQNCLVSMSFLVITAIVNSLGVIFSAGMGVAEKICAFIMLVPAAFSQALSAVVAQNVGAGKHDRARRALAYGILLSLLTGVFLGYLSFFHGTMLARIFTWQENVIFAAADYLKAYAIDTLFVSVLFCMIGYFNGYGSTAFVMIQGLVGAFLVRVPVSYFASRLPDTTLFKIGLATPASTVVQIILCVSWFLLMARKRLKQQEMRSFRQEELL